MDLEPKTSIVRASSVKGIPELQSFAVADVPSAAKGGRMIFVPDESGGPVPAYSDGTNWRRFSDGAIIS